MDLELYVSHPALGQAIQVLSLVLHISSKTTLYTPAHSNPKFEVFKSIFDIPDDVLIIDNKINYPNNGEPGDHAKFFSPYLKPSQINLFGKTFPINKTGNKPCIGIAIASNEKQMQEIVNSNISSLNDPRYYEYPVYEKIIKLALSSGYDVITFNGRTNLEEKIYQVSQLCDCIIGYEGGIAQLAHCFDVPCIMLPWGPTDSLIDNSYGIPITRAEKIHMDRSTYFLKSADEILSWTSADLNRIINDLYNKLGNNKLLTNEMIERINNDNDINRLIQFSFIDDPTNELRKKYMPNLTIGGFDNLALFVV